MSHTFTKIWMHVVFSTHEREPSISPKLEAFLFRHIRHLLKEMECVPLAINGMPDHIHAFIGLRPAMAISDLVRDIKNNSSNFINDNKFVKGKFSWQAGYGAFSYGHSQMDKVYNYILNQEKHHKKKTFREEYLEFLKKFEVEYDEKYLFEWIE